MGRLCNGYGSALSARADTLQYREDLVRIVIEFSQGTALPVSPGAETVFVAIFDRTVGMARAAGEVLDEVSQSFVAKCARVWAHEAEKAARIAGLSQITSPILEAAAERMILRARETERRRAAPTAA